MKKISKEEREQFLRTIPATFMENGSERQLRVFIHQTQQLQEKLLEPDYSDYGKLFVIDTYRHQWWTMVAMGWGADVPQMPVQPDELRRMAARDARQAVMTALALPLDIARRRLEKLQSPPPPAPPAKPKKKRRASNKGEKGEKRQRVELLVSKGMSNQAIVDRLENKFPNINPHQVATIRNRMKTQEK